MCYIEVSTYYTHRVIIDFGQLDNSNRRSY
jgi:hypothetical protein